MVFGGGTRSGQVDQAVARWARGGPLEQDASFLRRREALLVELGGLGTFEQWVVLRSEPLGDRARQVWLAAECAQGVLFVRTVAYRQRDDEVLTHLTWSRDPAEAGWKSGR